MRLFITGATGFLGAHIAEEALKQGHEVLALRRASSVPPFDPDAYPSLRWVCSGEPGIEAELRDFAPSALIHCAWGGVSAADRSDRRIQQENVLMTRELMHIYPWEQIVMMGSQDEYGRIDSPVTEERPAAPVSEYALAKLRCCEALEEYALAEGISWQWLRIFSVYGPYQRPQWLIPSLITRCLEGEAYVETTPGEQVYSYLWAEDFARAVLSTVGKRGADGIFNLSSSENVTLSSLFDLVKEVTGSDIEIRRVLPYREGQSMMITGDSSRFKAAFGEFETVPLREGISRMTERRKALIEKERH